MSRNGNGRALVPRGLDAITLNRLGALYDGMTGNAMRSAPWVQSSSQIDPDERRNINHECGLPDTPELTPQTYQGIYDRSPIAARVVEIIPKESWKVQPAVYEDEDENPTEFEEAWDELGKDVAGRGWYQDEIGSALWDYMSRADIASRISRYGVMLVGLDDGKDLNEPADGIDENGKQKGKPKGRKVNFIRVLPEVLAPINAWNNDLKSPRYGLPASYQITFSDPSLGSSGYSSQPTQTKTVHWSRVLHVCDNSHHFSSSEVLAISALQPVYDNVYGLRKIYNAAPEGFWKWAFPWIHFGTHPQLGGDVEIDLSAMRDMFEDVQNSLQKAMVTRGMSANVLSGAPSDPASQIQAQLEAICVKIGVPMRIFLGSERGELASSQDQSAWEWRMYDRFMKYCVPKIVCPFVDRMILLGVLPEPEGYSVSREKPGALGALERAQVASSHVDAMVKFVQGGAESLMTPQRLFTLEFGYEEEEAESIVEEAAKIAEERAEEDAALQEEQMAEQMKLAEEQAKAGGGLPGQVPPPQKPGQFPPKPGQGGGGAAVKNPPPKPPVPGQGGQKPPFVPGKPPAANAYNPSQPRDADGKWGSGGGGGGASLSDEKKAIISRKEELEAKHREGKITEDDRNEYKALDARHKEINAELAKGVNEKESKTKMKSSEDHGETTEEARLIVAEKLGVTEHRIREAEQGQISKRSSDKEGDRKILASLAEHSSLDGKAYRGMAFDSEEAARDFVARVQKDSSFKTPNDELPSFTDSKQGALGFASVHGQQVVGEGKSRNAHGVLLEVVPAKGKKLRGYKFGQADEREVVLPMGQSYKVLDVVEEKVGDFVQIRVKLGAKGGGMVGNSSEPPTSITVESFEANAYNPDQPRGSSGTFTPANSVNLPSGRTVAFVPHKLAREEKGAWTTVKADVEALDRAWRENRENRVGDGEGASEADRAKLERFRAFLGTGREVEQPAVTLDADGRVHFEDGRHRFAVLREIGAVEIPLSVPKQAAKALRRKLAEVTRNAYNPSQPRDSRGRFGSGGGGGGASGGPAEPSAAAFGDWWNTLDKAEGKQFRKLWAERTELNKKAKAGTTTSDDDKRRIDVDNEISRIREMGKKRYDELDAEGKEVIKKDTGKKAGEKKEETKTAEKKKEEKKEETKTSEKKKEEKKSTGGTGKIEGKDLDEIDELADRGQRSVIADRMNEQAVPAGVVKAHGMTTSEVMKKVEVDGMEYLFTDKTLNAAARTLEVTRAARLDVPERLLRSTQRTIHTEQENKDDDHWKNRYNDPNFKSAATGGDGTTVVYNGKGASISTVTHEAGHNFAKKVYGDTNPTYAHSSKGNSKGAKAYRKAQSEEAPVSTYAANSPAEDFAEACAGYTLSNMKGMDRGVNLPYTDGLDQMRKKFPKKYAAIHVLMTEDDPYQ